jgi:hypothetical protein
MSKNYQNSFLYIAITTLVLIIYFQVINYDFVSIDDHIYATGNSYVKDGLSWKNIKWAFTTFYAEFWHPITWLSLMLDTELYGFNPSGYHFTNILLHLLNAILLFCILKEATGYTGKSFIVAVLFAIHPLQVESVAWISERKNVLSTFFFLLTIWSYIKWTHKALTRNYITLSIFFILGLMSKSMIVTLPFVFLLIDFWPLRRVDLPLSRIQISKVLKEKIPLFFIMSIFIVLTVMAQHSGGGIVPLDSYSVGDRIANAIISYNKYLIKTVWPDDLSVFYPFPVSFDFMYLTFLSSFLLTLTILSIVSMRKKPYIAFGWLWYIGILVPVIGLVKIGDYSMADRFAYIPIIGLSIIFVWGLYDLTNFLGIKKEISVMFAAFIILLLTYNARILAKTWKNTNDLFKHAIAVSSENYFAHNALAHDLIVNGKLDKAVFHFSEAVRLRPEKVKLQLDYGRALIVKGKFVSAKNAFQKALEIKPEYRQAYYYLGITDILLEKPASALNSFYEASKKIFDNEYELHPEIFNQSKNFFKLGQKFNTQEKLNEAVNFYMKSISAHPGYLPAIKSLVDIYKSQNEFNKALALYQVKINNNYLIKSVIQGFDKWHFLAHYKSRK